MPGGEVPGSLRRVSPDGAAAEGAAAPDATTAAGTDRSDEAAASPVQAREEPGGGQSASRLSRALRSAPAIALNGIDVILAIGAGALVVLVHDVNYILSDPYWLDESWVADSVRAPLGLVPRLASSTPLGWTLLLRLMPAGGLERQRLVPLIFAGLAVSAAYLLGRELRLTRFTAGLLAAAAALLSPAMLVRDDLKQYTAEAFASILLWLLVARVETRWSRGRVAAVAVTASVGTLVAETAIFTGAAALACLGLAALVRRQWRRLLEVAVAAIGALAVYGVVYEVVVKPRINSQLSYIWSPDYAPGNVAGAALFFWNKLRVLAPYIAVPAPAPATGVPEVTASVASVSVSTAGAAARSAAAAASATPDLIVVLSVAGVGVVALALLGRFALAAMLPVTLAVVIAASAAGAYPFGDSRTSTFWLVLFPVMMAIAIAAVTHGIGAGLGRIRLWLRWALLPVIAVAGAAIAITYYARAVLPDVNSQLIAHDDTRSQVQFAEAHVQPGDIMLVDYAASYAFAYYSQAPATAYPVVPGNAAGFVPVYPGRPHVIVMTGRGYEDVVAAIQRARGILGAEPAATRGRVWIILEHPPPAERLAWRNAFTALTGGGGHVTIYYLSLVGYSPGYTRLALYTPPGVRPPATPPTPYQPFQQRFQAPAAKAAGAGHAHTRLRSP